jgi:hypothetical protein
VASFWADVLVEVRSNVARMEQHKDFSLQGMPPEFFHVEHEQHFVMVQNFMNLLTGF